jgi:hypothetical protein
VDALQRDVMQVVRAMPHAPRADVFRAILALATERGTGNRELEVPIGQRGSPRADRGARPTPPFLTEAWYCCAEPMPSDF